MKLWTKVLLSVGIVYSGAGVAASASNGMSLADMINQLPSKTLGSVCGAGQDASAVSDLCSAQLEAVRDQALKQHPGLNVENIHNQAQTVFENTLQPLINALNTGNQ
ncbi:hypothetical protein LDJ79_16200 [Vibrio tritonius]|uniref:Secreted protein n=1 Tax=Vibrio tritonius TaxID=1435069 RepID=A0ABS7YRK5_9VIBR|nr:hypothetical protein [Vibrio tritonius]MCA2017667.1 hypothetical protein [Vibrio tritonius]